MSGDPRVYMAAERTFLAWIRTGLALMGFGFVVARFGLFLRELALAGAPSPQHPGLSVPIGVALILAGIVVVTAAGFRHRRYVRAIDEGRFRTAFGSRLGFGLAAFLALVGLAMAAYLALI